MTKTITWFTIHPNHYHSFLQQKALEAGIVMRSVYAKSVLEKYPWQGSQEATITALKPGFLGIDWSYLRQPADNEITVLAGWNVPTYFMLLSYLALDQKHYYIYSDTPKPYKRNGVKQWLRRKWITYILSKAAGVLTTGQPGIEGFRQMGVPSNKIINFPFVTDLDFFKPKTAENVTSSNPCLLFSCGRLDVAHKGYDIALKSLASLKDTFSFRYYIGGEGPDRARIEQMIRDFKLTDCVELLGWVEVDTVKEWYQKCDVFLHPSRFDPFPNAVLEAMASGCVVVASDQAGSAKDRIVHGKNGYLFESENTNQLSDVLKDILSSEQAEAIRKNSRLTAEQWAYPFHISTLKLLTDG